MTETSQRIRAVARVGAAAPDRDGTLLPRRRPGHLGPIHIMQLLLGEAALVVVVAAVGHGPVALAGAGGAALVLLTGAVARRKGRWWLERRMMTYRYRQRQRTRPAGHRPDPRLTALRGLAPGLAVEDIAAPDGAQVGVARDDAGWYAVAAVSPTAAMRDEPNAGLPLDALLATLTEAGPRCGSPRSSAGCPRPGAAAACRPRCSTRRGCSPRWRVPATWSPTRRTASPRPSARTGPPGPRGSWPTARSGCANGRRRPP